MTNHHSWPALRTCRPMYTLPGLLAASSNVSSLPASIVPLPACLHTARPASCLLPTSHSCQSSPRPCGPVCTLPGLLVPFSRRLITPGFHLPLPVCMHLARPASCLLLMSICRASTSPLPAGLYAAGTSPDISSLLACTTPMPAYLHAARHC